MRSSLSIGQGKVLIGSRKRTEKQIKETQEKSEKIRSEVSILDAAVKLWLMRCRLCRYKDSSSKHKVLLNSRLLLERVGNWKAFEVALQGV